MTARDGVGSRTEITSELIERARYDRAAFGELYDHYLPRIFAFCRLHTASVEEAEDLTAVTFERALGAIDRYDERGLRFSAWLLRIAHNAIKDRLRRTYRAQDSNLRIGLSENLASLPDWEDALWLRDHIEALPPDYRSVVWLRFFEDCTFQQIGERMNRSEGAVKQLLRRALVSLYAQMQEEAEHE